VVAAVAVAVSAALVLLVGLVVLADNGLAGRAW
jgi:hypothetical protein